MGLESCFICIDWLKKNIVLMPVSLYVLNENFSSRTENRIEIIEKNKGYIRKPSNKKHPP